MQDDSNIIYKQLLRPEEASRYLRISERNLYRWAVAGKIKFTRTPLGHRRYPLEEILRLGGSTPAFISSQKPSIIITPTEKICYCRVSSSGQKKDLDSQVQYLRGKFPTHKIIKDIGSGLNFKRKGFRSLMVKAVKGHIKEIVVTHKDRLCRFGFQLIETILSIHGGKIVVLNREDTSPEKELISDLFSIITSFSGRVYGLRSGKIRKAIKGQIKDKESKVQNISN